MIRQNPTLDQQFKDAHREHAAGNLAAAMAKYREILSVSPAHFNACHLLGVALHQSGDDPGAIERISQALKINGTIPEAHFNLAAALHRQGRLKEAIQRPAPCDEVKTGLSGRPIEPWRPVGQDKRSGSR